ncbi:asl2534 [Nostoc sp. PCC 7120 = FACHB-418]|nr:asl2534 [Nostoc sp. PCC 7120 = FACHB-418]
MGMVLLLAVVVTFVAALVVLFGELLVEFVSVLAPPQAARKKVQAENNAVVYAKVIFIFVLI